MSWRAVSQSPRSTAVSVGPTTVPATPNGRMYRCTTAGTTSASEPTWGTTAGGTTTDGGAVWTEMTPDFEANNANVTGVEVSGGSYARASIASALANWAGTQGAGTTVASSGTTGVTSNNGALNYTTASAAWGTVAMFGLYDAATVGNLLAWGGINTPQAVNNGNTASVPAASIVWTED